MFNEREESIKPSDPNKKVLEKKVLRRLSTIDINKNLYYNKKLDIEHAKPVGPLSVIQEDKPPVAGGVQNIPILEKKADIPLQPKKMNAFELAM